MDEYEFDREGFEDEAVESGIAIAGSIAATSAFLNRKYIADQLSGKGIKLAKRVGGAVPIGGLVGLGYDAYQAPDVARSAFNTKDPTLGQTAAAGIYNMADGILMGQVQDKNAKIRQMHKFYSDIYDKAFD